MQKIRSVRGYKKGWLEERVIDAERVAENGRSEELYSFTVPVLPG